MIFIIKYNELVMKKNRIRLTESQLHKVIKESIQTILNETSYDTSKEHLRKQEKNCYLFHIMIKTHLKSTKTI